MAQIEAKVTQIGSYTIPTDKGNFTGRILYLDVPIFSGNTYHIQYSIDGQILHPFNTELSTYKQFDSDGSVHQTTFISDNGLVSYGNLSGDLKLYLKDTSGNVIFEGTITTTSKPTAFILPFLLMGTNNVPVWSFTQAYYYLDNYGVEYTTPSVNEFGTFKWVNDNVQQYNSYVVISPIDFDYGQIIYMSSSIYNEDPYAPGGSSQPDGGGGNYDNTNEPVDFPSLPAYSAIGSGLLTIFSPLIADIKSLADYLWSGLFDLDTFKKLYSNPMECIITLGLVPFTISNTTPSSVIFGNVNSGLTMPKVNNQYIIFDCGSISENEIKNYFKSYLDYEPYTKIEIYLPFIGFHQLSTDDLMGNTISLKYHIDLLTGVCVAMIKSGNHVLYSFTGQCFTQIPVTASNWSTLLNGIISSATSIGAAAVGAVTPPLAMGNIASAAINTAKPSIEKSGSITGSAGLLAIKKPYLVITRPRQCVPKNQNKFIGYPSFINSSIGDLSGYTEIESIHLKNVPCTQEEMNEIENILKNGVIL